MEWFGGFWNFKTMREKARVGLLGWVIVLLHFETWLQKAGEAELWRYMKQWDSLVVILFCGGTV